MALMTLCIHEIESIHTAVVERRDRLTAQLGSRRTLRPETRSALREQIQTLSILAERIEKGEF